MPLVLIAAAAAFAASLLLTPLVRDRIGRLAFLDLPGARKVHNHPTPRAGGIAIAAACALAYGLVAIVAGEHGSEARRVTLQIAPAAFLVFMAGVSDDLVGLNPWAKLAVQCTAGVVAFGNGVAVHAVAGFEFPAWLSFVATIAWLLLCTNAVNLIDGIDGLAAGVGLFAASTTLVSALLSGNTSLALATAPLAAAILGFLRYNFNPATIFLGDSGSLLIGFLLGSYGILWSQKSATILGMTAPMMALAIPLLDTALTVARRFLRRKPIFGADRGHIHHRLLDRGLTVRRAALLLYAACAVGAVCSLLVFSVDSAAKVEPGWVIVLFCGIAWIGIQKLDYIEFAAAWKLLRAGAFRRQIAAQLQMETLRRGLAKCESVEQAWPILVEAAQELGFHRVRMRVAGRVFDFRAPFEPASGWHMSVPIGGGDVVELARRFESESHSTALSSFADELRRSLSALRGERRELAKAAGA